jgi:septal ring factor EnvC (AmiA/AmiB activator)
MDDQPTCGQGLAEHSELPAKVSELMAATAANLEAHQKTLDLSDENSRKELDAYVALAREHRSLADQLRATAQRMAAYRDLPMGRHDERALADPRLVAAFAKYVKVEQELLAQLRRAVERDQQMLAAFSGQERG